MDEYQKLIEKKVVAAEYNGFDICPSEIHPSLFDHQRDIVQWAVKGGCRAVFASFGLGKTRMNIEICRHILNYEGGKALIIGPLGVRQEFTKKDGPAMGVQIAYCSNMEEVEAAGTPYIFTNYERIRLGHIDVTKFTVVTLDEASVLRSTGSDTFDVFMEVFKTVKYKFVFTATPSPTVTLNLSTTLIFWALWTGGRRLHAFLSATVRKRAI